MVPISFKENLFNSAELCLNHNHSLIFSLVILISLNENKPKVKKGGQWLFHQSQGMPFFVVKHSQMNIDKLKRWYLILLKILFPLGKRY